MTTKFWQRDRSSVENSATFKKQTCLGCHRSTHPIMVPPARPICIMPSYDEAEIVKHVATGHPYDDTLPEWDPVGCSQLFPTTEPVLHLKMDDNAANPIVHDVRGVYPQTFLAPGGNPNTSAHSVTGKFGTALSFGGVRDSIELTPASYESYLAANQDFTMCMWLRTTTTLGTVYKGWIGNSGNALNGMEINENKIGLSWTYKWTWVGGTFTTSFVIGPLAVNTWLFIGLRRTGSVIRYYKNNTWILGGSNAACSRTFIVAGQPFRIARGSTNSVYRQMIVDDFRLYNYPLTDAQMLAIYNGTL